MASTGWVVEQLSKRHRRDGFDCGESPLNEFFKRYATQNAKRGLSQTYVAVLPPDRKSLGYYTISSGSIGFRDLLEADRKKLPQYPIPVVLLARLAVDKQAQGKGLGEHLLMDALSRSARVADEIGVYAVAVDAISDNARRFYEKYGFKSLKDHKLHLFMGVKDIKALGLS